MVRIEENHVETMAEILFKVEEATLSDPFCAFAEFSHWCSRVAVRKIDELLGLSKYCSDK